MADQAQSPAAAAPVATRNAAVRQGFHPRGQPVILGVNRIGLWSLYMKEVRRFLKVQTQTIWAPAVTTLLFLVIFTVALSGTGRSGREVLGVPFASFVAPGLIVMGMMQNAFANSSFSFLSGKIQGTIIDLLMPPLSQGELSFVVELPPGTPLANLHVAMLHQMGVPAETFADSKGKLDYLTDL